MLDQFLEFVARHRLCNKSDATLLAVSGGIDSTVMFYLFKEAGFKVGVAHANFQLRGAESEGDQAFVTQLCATFEVPLFVRRFDTEKYAWEKSLSIQLAARELRYVWFRELINQQGYTHIATAHHFDDSMETVLLNLARGSGIDGLAGIPVKNGLIIRPMMFASRKQVEHYADLHGIVWREDASNQTDNYQRNYIRHHVMPHLRALNPSLDVTWRKGSQKVKLESMIIQDAVDVWKGKFVREENGRLRVSKDAFAAASGNPVMLWRYIRDFGFNFEQATDILQSIPGQSGKRFYSISHLLVIDRAELIIVLRGDEWSEVLVEVLNQTYHMGHWTLSLHAGSADDLDAFRRAIAAETVAENNGFSTSNGSESWKTRERQVLLDAAKVSFPLTWRKWKNGDHFYPLGLGHRKKLSDLFVDMKLPVADKDVATVVESGGEIIWIAGLRIDDRFKITDATTNCISLNISYF